MSIPAQMTAMVLMGHGGIDQLHLRTDWPTPEPVPGEVLVRVRACGLNNTDINTRTAWYSEEVESGITEEGASSGFAEADASDATWGGNALAFPRIQGADIAGEVAGWAPDVSGFEMGGRVMVDPWLLAEDPDDLSAARYLGSEVDGGFAQFCVVPAENVHPIVTDLSDAELATFACAATTAENLISRADVGAGDTVVLTGASGGVGTCALQLAVARGAEVIAVASAAKAAALLDLGASAVVDRAAPDLADAVLRASTVGRIDVVADVVGASMFEVLVPILRPGGRYTTSGAIAGALVELDLRHLIYRDLQFTGATVCPPGTMARVVRSIETGELRPQLAATYPLAELGAAQEAFAAKRHVGNIVVEVP